MSQDKYGADLYINSEDRIGGSIIITDTHFTWKATLGSRQIELPIDAITGYHKKKSHLSINAKGVAETMVFYTWKADSIIKAIQERNSTLQEVDSSSLTKLQKERSPLWLVVLQGAISIAALVYGIYQYFHIQAVGNSFKGLLKAEHSIYDMLGAGGVCGTYVMISLIGAYYTYRGYKK